MKPTRKTQPYRKGKTRPSGPTLCSILLGKPGFAPHPLDAQRKLQKRRPNRRK